MKFSSKYIEGLKKQTRQRYEDKGLEWRGKVIPLRCLDPSTGSFKTINLDFRDDVKGAENASSDLRTG